MNAWATQPVSGCFVSAGRLIVAYLVGAPIYRSDLALPEDSGGDIPICRCPADPSPQCCPSRRTAACSFYWAFAR